MNVRRLARFLLVLLDVIVLVGSGTYLIVYLYRWEWNRALVSGLFFVVAEVVLFSIVILGRLSRLEGRLVHADDERHAAAAGFGPNVDPVPAEGWRRDAPERGPFAWLGDGAGVFVPVLLGVGAILSAIAYVVEHIASSTAPSRNEALQAHPSLIEAPEEPLAPNRWEAHRIDDDLERRPPAGRGSRAASSIVALLVTALLVVASVNGLAELTQNRPDPELAGMASTFTLEIRVRDEGEGVPAPRVADALWISCRGTLPAEVTATVLAVDGRYVQMRLDPAIGHNARRRFVGCLQDLTLEGALADVDDFENVPSGEGPA